MSSIRVVTSGDFVWIPCICRRGCDWLGCEFSFVGYLKRHNGVLKICVLSSTAWQLNKGGPNWIAVALFAFLLPLGNACKDFQGKKIFLGFKDLASKIL